ncbi:HypC/HybG/HupF family hydrogenase formation chaperone [Patescibacteria group bacterium]|nr:HypC/HybG/HupF family hydrogenase formation chaperone [Patescibacteria group bacterium]
MCLTIPGKIIKINKNKAEVQQGQNSLEIDVSLLLHIRVGDYILEQSGFAIQKISKKEALKTLNLLKQHNYDK